MTDRRPWHREPALHFVLIGAALFALDAWRRPPRPDAREVAVTAAFVRGLRAEHERRTGRAPTPAELRAEVDRFVREEVLYREALALGLERGDVIVRRRLVQKMEFLAEDVAAPRAPTDDELRRYLAEHAGRYAAPARVSFRHAFFDRGRRGDAAEADARAALERLRSGAAGDAGDPFALGASFTEADLGRVAGDFGEGFARALTEQPEGAWSGPVASRYGLHVVMVTGRSPGGPAPLDAVRDRVAADWTGDRREAANREAYRRILEGYRVRVEGL